MASTESAKPADVASPGSTTSSARTAAPSARVPAARPPACMPSSATVPMTAARSTDGSGLAIRTKPTTPRTPTTRRPAAAHACPPGEQQHEAEHQREVGS